MIVGADAPGFEFISRGFPEDEYGPNAGRPTPRLFKGHFQRTFDWSSDLSQKYQYHAAELNISCPWGLSGGPVYGTESDTAVTGLVCENVDTSTWLDSVEVADGERGNMHHFVRYGICCLLEPFSTWVRATSEDA